jgi:cardiolipin synthase
VNEYWTHVTVLGALSLLATVVVIPWVLLTKKEPTTAVAWVLVVLLMPLVGSLLFWSFGYNYLLRRVRHRRRARPLFRERHPPAVSEGVVPEAADPPVGEDLGRLAQRVNAFPVSQGNAVTLFYDTTPAYEALLDAVEGARHHVHLEYFIFRSDQAGHRLLDLLVRKAKEGVEVRLLVDAMGARNLGPRTLAPLRAAGGRAAAFLSINPLRSRLQVNLRNHRKIVVVDGRVAFTGGMNIGDEYLGRSERFGYWRDTVVRVEGPAAHDLQRVFCEDWDFASRETVGGPAYFPEPVPAGDAAVQVAESGPDQEVNTIREIYFAAVLSARERLWIASPYCVPDAGLLDALRLARYRGVDVRFLTLSKPDHLLSFYAGRYYWGELLDLRVKIYQYVKGMMHSKVVLVDDRWAMVGSANLDNRSLRLNFEAGCALHTPALVADLADAFRRDLADARPLEPADYARRSRVAVVFENACRLLAPTL